MNPQWALYRGMAQKKNWSQRRQDRQAEIAYQTQVADFRENQLNQINESEAQMNDYLNQMKEVQATEQDKQRMQEEFDKMKTNLITDIAKNGGDVSKWMKTGGIDYLNKFSDEFKNSDAYKNGITNKRAFGLLSEAFAKDQFVGDVDVTIREDDGKGNYNYTTKKMNATDALRKFKDGDIVSIDPNTVIGRDKFKWGQNEIRQLLASHPGRVGQTVSAEDIFNFVKNSTGDIEQAKMHANSYAQMVNEAIKKDPSDKNAGWRYALTPDDAQMQKYKQWEATFEQRERQNQLAADKFNANKNTYQERGSSSYGVSGSQRTGSSSGGMRSSGGGGGGGARSQSNQKEFMNLAGASLYQFQQSGNKGIAPGSTRTYNDTDFQYFRYAMGNKVREVRDQDTNDINYTVEDSVPIYMQNANAKEGYSTLNDFTLANRLGRSVTFNDFGGRVNITDPSTGQVRTYQVGYITENSYNGLLDASQDPDNIQDYTKSAQKVFIPINEDEATQMRFNQKQGVKTNTHTYETQDWSNQTNEQYIERQFINIIESMTGNMDTFNQMSTAQKRNILNQAENQLAQQFGGVSIDPTTDFYTNLIGSNTYE